jgi:hypothetical protein
MKFALTISSAADTASVVLMRFSLLSLPISSISPVKIYKIIADITG